MKLPTIMYSKDHPAMPGQEFLIRTKQPLVVGQVIHFKTRNALEEFIRNESSKEGVIMFAGANQYEGTTLVVYCGLLSDWDAKELTSIEVADKIPAIMRRMSDWYEFNITKK